MDGGREGGGGSDGEDGKAPLRAALAPRPDIRPRGVAPGSHPWTAPAIGLLQRIGGTSGVVWHWIIQSYAYEISSGNRFSWYVVAFAAGAAVYLALPLEPSF